MQSISFKAEDYNLAGALFYPERIKEKNPAILFVHGWTSEKERSYQYAEALSKLGYICFLFDMRGHGDSEGDIKTFTIREFFNDVLVACDYLSNMKGVDKENISAIGSSFGGYLIALLTEKRSIKNLVLRAPADYPNADFDKVKFVPTDKEAAAIIDWRKRIKKADETYALRAISRFPGNILIIKSEKDDMVPHGTIENYVNAVKDENKLTHTILKGAPHSIKEGKFRDEVTRILVEWFKDKL